MIRRGFVPACLCRSTVLCTGRERGLPTRSRVVTRRPALGLPTGEGGMALLRSMVGPRLKPALRRGVSPVTRPSDGEPGGAMVAEALPDDDADVADGDDAHVAATEGEVEEEQEAALAAAAEESVGGFGWTNACMVASRGVQGASGRQARACEPWASTARMLELRGTFCGESAAASARSSPLSSSSLSRSMRSFHGGLLGACAFRIARWVRAGGRGVHGSERGSSAAVPLWMVVAA